MVDFEQLNGPFVLWFDGEGRHSVLCDFPEQVIEYLMRDDGGGWSIDGTRETLLECLNDSDNWVFSDDDKPFAWHIALGEIAWANIIVGCRHVRDLLG